MRRNLSIATFILVILISSMSSTQAYGIPGSFETTFGSKISYSAYEGEYLFLEAIWTGCSACQSFHSTMVEIYNKYNANITILTIAYQSRDNMDTVKQWEADYPSSWTTGLDYNLGNLYGLTATPTSILFDTSGREIKRWVGDMPISEFEPVFDQIVKGETSISTDVDVSNTDSGSLIGDLFANPFFQLGVFSLIGIMIFMKVTAPKKI